MSAPFNPPNQVPPAALKTAVLAQVLRSGEVESVHRGSIAVCDARGRLLAHTGDPLVPVFWRSTAKLHQAIPLVMAGGISRWQLSEPQLAIMCASHNGEPAQVQCVSSILHRIGLGPHALRCGAHEPQDLSAAHELVRRGEKPSPLHNTCSGNHAGLLALGQLLGADPNQYDALAHPAQQRALTVVAQFAGLPASEIFTGIDGCGIPAYRTPLSALATAFARLMSTPSEWDKELKKATARIVSAVTRHSDFINGAGGVDTELIRAFQGSAVCKLGAEAMCAAAFAPTPRFPDGLGIALKIEDGQGNRARSVALAAVLQQLELGTADQRAAFDRFIERSVKTRRGEIVGEIRPALQLSFTA